MTASGKNDVETELQFIEKMYRLGDDESVMHLARGLLLSETLTKAQKKRIRKVLNGHHYGGRGVTAFIVVLVLIAFYLYIKYAM